MPGNPEEARPADPPASGAAKPLILKFHYIKSSLFRVVHVDGAHGGIVPSGGIHMALFSERSPIPQQSSFPLNPEGTLGPEVMANRVGKEGVVREVEVDLRMDLTTAEAVAEWLKIKVEELKRIQKDQEAGRKS